MPHNQREPRPYGGTVISLIGNSYGQEITMDFAAAQSNVAAGTAKWVQDKSPLSPTQARVAKERQAFAGPLNPVKTPKSVDEALRSAAQPVRVIAVQRDMDEAPKISLARPFPQVAIVHRSLISDGSQNYVRQDEDGTIVFDVENGRARYNVAIDGDAEIILELEEAEQPEVDVPADWRELHHFKKVAIAKQIRGTKDNMSSAQAEAAIEDWTSTDDQVRTDESGEAGAGEKETEEEREARREQEAGNQQDPGGQEARERSRQAEAEFVNDGEPGDGTGNQGGE